jgi:hypothetical protein
MSAQGKSGTAHPQERMSAFGAVADSLCTFQAQRSITNLVVASPSVPISSFQPISGERLVFLR